MSLKKWAVGAGLGLAIALPMASFAQTTTPTSVIQALLDQIKSLQQQIAALQQQQQTLVQQQVSAIKSLATTLQQGNTGDNVKILQALLATDPSVYPEGLITGFYGPLTSKAVAKFQTKHGLESVGNVGPKTLKLLNSLLEDSPVALENGSSTEGDDQGDHGERHGKLCAIVPPGHLIAPGWLKKNGGEVPVIPACQTLPPGILGILNGTHGTTTATSTAPVVTLTAASTSIQSGATTTLSWSSSNATSCSASGGWSGTLATSGSQAISPTTSTTYSLMCSGAGGSATQSVTVTVGTPVDTTAPVISNLGVSSIASTSAVVSWTTNEDATGKVYYGTTSPVDLLSSSTLSVNSTSLSQAHTFSLTSLASSTTYFYVVESKDASNNTATTSTQAFATIAQ